MTLNEAQREAALQYGPFPSELDELVQRLRYRPGWVFALEFIERDKATSHGNAAGGLTFIVTTKGYDAYHPEQGEWYRVNHYFPVPAATFNRESWLRWLLDCILDVENHETREFFAIDIGGPEQSSDVISGTLQRPFAPTHGPGDNPYTVVQYATDQQRRTRFTGEVYQQ